jgi:hypothetical protein
MFGKVTWKIVKKGKSDRKEKISKNVEADLKDLVTAKRSKSMPASFVFGESKVSTNLIREYEAAGHFPTSDGRAPLDEQVPTPAPAKLWFFETSSPVGSDFPVILC